MTAGIDAEHNIGLVSRELEPKLEGYQLPDGYKIEFAGETELIKSPLSILFTCCWRLF